ncbi:MAG: hypothetical protein ABIP63_08265, partial [Thermoanaerobaculia bacterium]
MIAETLEALRSAPQSEIVVVSVVPVSSVGTAAVKGLPGKVIDLTPEEFPQFAAVTQRPRVEMWSSRGELLLLRVIPNYSGASELLNEEMLSARS